MTLRVIVETDVIFTSEFLDIFLEFLETKTQNLAVVNFLANNSIQLSKLSDSLCSE